VADLAFHLEVPPLEGKPGVLVSLRRESRRAEAVDAVAICAVGLPSGERGLAGVRIPVTGAASLERWLEPGRREGIVAAGALHGSVAPDELKARPVVVEGALPHLAEPDLGVASSAIGAEAAGVRVPVTVSAARVGERLEERMQASIAVDGQRE
jgi:hypothetical protein